MPGPHLSGLLASAYRMYHASLSLSSCATVRASKARLNGRLTAPRILPIAQHTQSHHRAASEAAQSPMPAQPGGRFSNHRRQLRSAADSRGTKRGGTGAHRCWPAPLAHAGPRTRTSSPSRQPGQRSGLQPPLVSKLRNAVHSPPRSGLLRPAGGSRKRICGRPDRSTGRGGHTQKCQPPCPSCTTSVPS